MNNEVVSIREYMNGLVTDYFPNLIHLGNTDIDTMLEEAESRHGEKFRLEILDVEKFIKVNECKLVDDPVFFNGPTPSPRGLLSQEIFGITKTERAGIYAYIDLGGTFIHPVIYKALTRLNAKIDNIVAGIGTFNINSDGDIVEDPNGDTGIDWLRKNFDRIKFKPSDSRTRNTKIKFIQQNKDKMWIKRFIVIPPYYRDVETREGGVGVGEINKLYSSLIIASKSLKENAEYGLSLSDATKHRIQTTLQAIYDWFGGGTVISGEKTGGNLPGKTGLIKRGILYKTVDYSVRLVLSAPQLKAETIDDIMVDMDHAAEPLAAALCNFKPFVIFWMRRFFENEFAGKMEYPIGLKNGDIVSIPLEDYQVVFSDERINEEIERFIHGYSNRFIPIEVPIDKQALVRVAKEKKISVSTDQIYLRFKGRNVNKEDYKPDNNEDMNNIGELIDRPLTWCDLFYRAACEVTKDKMVLITRFPIDSYLNQYPSQIRIKSTTKTEAVVISGELYKWYPKIRKEDIGTNTSPLFEDTLSISNGLIGAMMADYDGDTAIVKPVYTVEANQECREAANAKVQVVGMDGKITRDISKENILALYSITYEPDPSVKFIDPVF